MKFLFAILTITLLTGCFGSEPQKTSHEGESLPEFTLLLTDSISSINTRDIPANKHIALVYFSPYCSYSRAQVEEIVDEIENLKNIQFYFITRYPISDLKKFNDEFQLSKYPNITTGVDTAHFVADYFEAPGVPYIAIYGKDKKLHKTFLGKIYSNQLIKVVKE